MVGGKVIETIDTGERVWINTRDGKDTCAIYVERSFAARSVSVGDSVWWQGMSAYWTPATKAFKDYKLEKTSFSGVKKPEVLSNEPESEQGVNRLVQ